MIKKKQKAIIIHGSGGNPEECWFPWLKQKLEEDGFEAIVPAFPSDEKNQKLENWIKKMKEYSFDDETIIVGHSLGCPFILNLLEQKKFKNVYLVAGFVGLLNNQFDEVIKTFSDKTFDWEKINKNYEKIAIIYSDDDPYVKPEKALELGENLNTLPTLIKNAGHFNSESNYYEFPYLLEQIKRDNTKKPS